MKPGFGSMGRLMGRKALSLLLCSLLIAPPSFASQFGSQGSAGSTNSQGAQLAQMMSILSMAAGALSMAAGAQELACCAQGCMTGAGANAGAEGAAIDAKAGAAGSSISVPPISMPPASGGSGGDEQPTVSPVQRTPTDLPKRFPDSASSFQCPRAPGFVFQLFRPQAAQASGCADGMIALLTGGLMMAMGLMGMQGAQQADTNANQAYQNQGNLSGLPTSLNPFGPNGYTDPNKTANNNNDSDTTGGSTSPGGTKLGSNSNSQPIKIDPALLSNGKAAEVMSRFEEKFGIPREKFAEAVAAGKDPRELLAKAPKNALSTADMAKAMTGAAGLTDAQKAAALDKAGLKAMQAEMLASLGDAGNEYKGGGGGGLPKAKSVSLGDLGLEAEEAGQALALSPEVQAALAARELASRKPERDLTLFQLVHRKYRERTKMIFGYGVKDGPGVADANGF